MESYWRHKGFTPTISDDQKLWCVERDRVGIGEKEIALIGSSRMLCDISMPTIISLLPSYKVVNLAVDGACPNDILDDLAHDSSFRGIVICDITEECILFGSEGPLSVKSFVRFRDRVYNLNIKINRKISTYLQSKFTVCDPYLSLTKVVGELLLSRKSRSPRYWTINTDRSHSMDYTALNIEKYRAKRLSLYEKNLAELKPAININAFMKQVTAMEKNVQKIKSRGGNVVFFYMPMTDEHWELCSQVFPMNEYWDLFTKFTSAVSMHFIHIPEMARLKCPDTSHLDLKDTPEFTKALVKELIKIRLVQDK
jgi:hypothetical protein